MKQEDVCSSEGVQVRTHATDCGFTDEMRDIDWDTTLNDRQRMSTLQQTGHTAATQLLTVLHQARPRSEGSSAVDLSTQGSRSPVNIYGKAK